MENSVQTGEEIVSSELDLGQRLGSSYLSCPGCFCTVTSTPMAHKFVPEIKLVWAYWEE